VIAGVAISLSTPGLLGQMMRDLLRWLLVGAAVLAANAAVAERLVDGVPIPDDAELVDVRDPKVGSFQGIWAGRWGGKRKHILIVERVDPDGTAHVIYADLDPSGTTGRSSKPKARVRGATLTAYLSGATATYQMTAVNWIEARYSPGDSPAELKRINSAALPGMTIPEHEGESIRIDSGLLEKGRQIQLEVVIFKPPGAGPFPLLVVNHGSTIHGDNPELFTWTFAKAAFAEIFVKKGYLVAYPQRRGRGKSDGRYDEGFNAARTHYSCDPDISRAGADRALADIEAAVAILRRRRDVATGPILIAGHSRGGALSIAYAGKHPNDVRGVINFAGGWLDDKCLVDASVVNSSLPSRYGTFPRPTLWLYGVRDSLYSQIHTAENFKAFQKAGGRGELIELDVPDRDDDHEVMFFPLLWKAHVDRYLR
jgi:dienelactone hydrolase